MDDRARLENKSITDVVVKALENLLSVPSASSEDSEVIRLSRQVKEVELEVARLEGEQAYVDAKEQLRLVSIEIQWSRGDGESFQWTTKDKAEIGSYAIEGGRRRRISVSDYDQWVKDKPVNERIVAEYEGRIRGLKDKVEALKAEIVKPDVGNQ